MKPDYKKHMSYYVIEPMSGIPREVALRFQISIWFDNKHLIPILWNEVTFKVDDDMAKKINMVHFILLWLPVIVTALTAAFITFFIVYALK